MSYDVVFVGSGINSLAGAALLARAGRRVLVLERNDYLGGAIRTAEITEPGFTHEVFSSWHPLFMGSAAYAELGDELHARGLEYLNTELATGSLFPDGESIFLTTSHEANVEEFDRHAAGDGAAWDRTVSEFMPNADLAFGVLGTELWSSAGAGPRPEGVPAPRPPRSGRVRRRRALDLPRLGHGDVRGPPGSRSPRTLGAAHRRRPGRCLVRLHDAGDRRGDRARRHARAAGRRRCARRGPGRHRPRRRRRARDRPRGRADRRARGPRDRRRPRRWRDDRGHRGRDRERDPDAAVRAPARRNAGGDRGEATCAPVPLRPRRDADPHGAQGGAEVGGRRASRRRRRSST